MEQPIPAGAAHAVVPAVPYGAQRWVQLAIGVVCTPTTNYGFLYMAQGVGSILGGPLAALLYQNTGTWTGVFAVVITMDFATAILALWVLKPARRRYLAA